METGQSVGQKKERGYIFAVFSWGSAAFFYLIKFCQLPNKYLLKKQVHPEGVSNKRVRHFLSKNGTICYFMEGVRRLTIWNFKKFQIGGKNMEGKHPKRRKEKYNPYNICEQDGHYYISFRDGEGVYQRFEINKTLCEAFNRFELADLSYLNVWDRHIEQSEIWETSLNERALEKPETVEDIVFRNIQTEDLYKAIDRLPDIQKRRIWMYFFEGMTYEQIAEFEKCKHPAVVKSVKAALKNLKKFLSE